MLSIVQQEHNKQLPKPKKHVFIFIFIISYLVLSSSLFFFRSWKHNIILYLVSSYLILSYDQFGNFLSYLDVGEEYELNFHKFQIIEFIPITGLQIKLDPGITTIYFGFGLLMLSIFLSYRSFSQIWLNKEKNTIFVGGKTNRAQLSFEKEILDIILSLKNK